MTEIDARLLREVMSRFADALEEHREEIDSLNVFPVPDGDTGTNMALTQRAVREALDAAGPLDLAGTGLVITRASLMGARGNSGVILAQVFRGLCDRLCDGSTADSRALAEALAGASGKARRAVARPVEGTVLTVLAHAADAANRTAVAGGEVASVAQVALEAARSASDRTREMLPELLSAGVVDAGGRGMVLLFDSLSAVLRGGKETERVGSIGPVGHAAGIEPGPLQQKFEIMYLWNAAQDELPALTRALNELGDSVVVVGGGGMFKVHVHTNDPDAARAAGEAHGSARDVHVVDLESEVAEHCVSGQARAVRASERQASGLVAVAEGDGLIEIFRSLGAVVVRGGPGRSPSVGELLAAIDEAPSDAVVLLTTHPDLDPAAKEAAAKSEKRVVVLPARSMQGGVAAAAAFNPMDDLDEGLVGMKVVSSEVESIEVARATKDAGTPAGSVRAGQWLGSRLGHVEAVADDPAAAAAAVAGRHRGDRHDLATVYVGEEADPNEAEAIVTVLRDALPGLEIKVHDGGQPRFSYLIGLE